MSGKNAFEVAIESVTGRSVTEIQESDLWDDLADRPRVVVTARCGLSHEEVERQLDWVLRPRLRDQLPACVRRFL